MKKSKRKKESEKEPEFELDVLTEEEQKIFLDKLDKVYFVSEQINKNKEIEDFSASFNCPYIEKLKKMSIRFKGGFAVLNYIANQMHPGSFYIIKDNDLYKVSTIKIIKDRKPSELSQNYHEVCLIKKNGFNDFNDKEFKDFAERINQVFVKNNQAF